MNSCIRSLQSRSLVSRGDRAGRQLTEDRAYAMHTSTTMTESSLSPVSVGVAIRATFLSPFFPPPPPTQTDRPALRCEAAASLTYTPAVHGACFRLRLRGCAPYCLGFLWLPLIPATAEWGQASCVRGGLVGIMYSALRNSPLSEWVPPAFRRGCRFDDHLRMLQSHRVRKRRSITC